MTGDTAPALDADASDLALIRAIAQCDEQALEALYARHCRLLLAYLMQQLGDQALAEEVLQDVMLGVWKGAAGFRGECRVRTWLMAIARHRALTARQRRTNGRMPLDDDLLQVSPFGQTHQAVKDNILAALNQLPPPERETILLIFYHNLSGPEVAVVMEVPEGTVRSRLRRAKVRLHQLLREGEPRDA
jgi:RNA polymerase sigma-70 factor (ECF subfamily)